MTSTAVFGGVDGEYRYMLSRTWDESRPSVMFVLMNPSTADIRFNDPTVAKCCRYAVEWGYGSLWVGNSCAYRATDQRRLVTAPDPKGPENDRYLAEMADRASLIVMAYGKPHESLRYRGLEVAMLLSHGGNRPLHVLKLCKDGTPSHPLYLKGDLRPTVWRVSEDAGYTDMPPQSYPAIRQTNPATCFRRIPPASGGRIRSCSKGDSNGN